MTRKDYVKLAQAIRIACSEVDSIPNYNDRAFASSGACIVIESIIRVLANDNQNFDKARFMDACNYAHPVNPETIHFDLPDWAVNTNSQEVAR